MALWLWYICFFNAVGNFSNKNVNVTTIMFLMSGDLTGLCLYIIKHHFIIEMLSNKNANNWACSLEEI